MIRIGTRKSKLALWQAHKVQEELNDLGKTSELDLIESEAYETLGGLLVENFESIPKEGTEISIGDYTFIAEQVSETHIEIVLLKSD